MILLMYPYLLGRLCARVNYIRSGLHTKTERTRIFRAAEF